MFYFIVLTFLPQAFTNEISLKNSQNLNLSKFACDVVESELNTNFYIRNVAIFDGEHNFSSNLIESIQKCLPKVPQITIKLDFNEDSILIHFPKSTMILIVADKIDKV